MKTFRTCLIIFLAVVASLILLIVLLFVGGGIYGQWRMAQVTQDLASLARELGYTPDAHLYHKIAKRDVNLVTGSGYCSVVLIFSTSMDSTEFIERLNQVAPETKKIGMQAERSNNLYSLPGLAIDGIDTRNLRNLSRLKPVTEYDRFLSSKKDSPSLILYETMNSGARIEHEGRQVEGNIIRLSVDGGSFPIWVNCPVTFSNVTEAPFD